MSSQSGSSSGVEMASLAPFMGLDPAKFPSLPTKKALLLIDFQNDFVTKEGAVSVSSADDTFVEAAAKLASAFRDIGVVIWVQSQFEAPRRFIEGQQIITSVQEPRDTARRDHNWPPVETLDMKAPLEARDDKLPIKSSNFKLPPIADFDINAPLEARDDKSPIEVSDSELDPMPILNINAPLEARDNRSPIKATESKLPPIAALDMDAPLEARDDKLPIKASNFELPPIADLDFNAPLEACDDKSPIEASDSELPPMPTLEINAPLEVRDNRSSIKANDSELPPIAALNINAPPEARGNKQPTKSSNKEPMKPSNKEPAKPSNKEITKPSNSRWPPIGTFDPNAPLEARDDKSPVETSKSERPTIKTLDINAPLKAGDDKASTEPRVNKSPMKQSVDKMHKETRKKEKAGRDPEAFLSSRNPTCVVRGTPGWQLATPLKKIVDPKKDVLLMKTHYSAFEGTKLISILRSKLVTSLYICGSLINVGVHATTVDAAAHGYSITLVNDCCGFSDRARFNAAMENLKNVSGCAVVGARSIAPDLGIDADGKIETGDILTREIAVGKLEADSLSDTGSEADRLEAGSLDLLKNIKQKYALRSAAARTRASEAEGGDGKTSDRTRREVRVSSRPRSERKTKDQKSVEKTKQLQEGMDKLSLSEGKKGETSADSKKSAPAEKTRDHSRPELTKRPVPPYDYRRPIAGGRPAVADPTRQPGRGGAPAGQAAKTERGVQGSRQGSKSNDASENSRSRSKGHQPVDKVKSVPSEPPASGVSSGSTPKHPKEVKETPPRPAQKPLKDKEAKETTPRPTQNPATERMSATTKTTTAPAATPAESAPDNTSKPKESEPLCEGDTKVFYDVLPPPLEAGIFNKLKDEVDWKRMSHLGGEVPRLVAVQGTTGPNGAHPVYRHPADESPPLLPFTPTVEELRKVVEKHLGHELNHVLIQFYRDGKDYISEHSDKTLDIAPGSYIANLSLGAERTMVFRTKRPEKEPVFATSAAGDSTAEGDKKEKGEKEESDEKQTGDEKEIGDVKKGSAEKEGNEKKGKNGEVVEVSEGKKEKSDGEEKSKEQVKGKTVKGGKAKANKTPETGSQRETQRARLPHNSLLRMGLKTNATWLHSIRQDKRPDFEKTAAELSFQGARISLTFRKIGTFLDEKEEFIWGQGARGKTEGEKREVVNGDEEQGEKMIRAFGVENRMGKGFDWERWYGKGFDVLHMK